MSAGHRGIEQVSHLGHRYEKVSQSRASRTWNWSVPNVILSMLPTRAAAIRSDSDQAVGNSLRRQEPFAVS